MLALGLAFVLLLANAFFFGFVLPRPMVGVGAALGALEVLAGIALVDMLLRVDRGSCVGAGAEGFLIGVVGGDGGRPTDGCTLIPLAVGAFSRGLRNISKIVFISSLQESKSKPMVV